MIAAFQAAENRNATAFHLAQDIGSTLLGAFAAARLGRGALGGAGAGGAARGGGGGLAHRPQPGDAVDAAALSAAGPGVPRGRGPWVLRRLAATKATHG